LSQIYVPGLRREELCLVRKARRLPVKGRALVERGERVSHDRVVARAEIEGAEFVVDVYDELHFLMPVLDQYIFQRSNLLKDVGDAVERDEVIAERRAWGLFRTSCTSPVKGRIERIDIPEGPRPTSALMRIRTPPVILEVDAYIPGVVAEVLPGEGAVIETAAAFIQGTFGIGPETSGRLAVAPSAPGGVLRAAEVGEEYAGKVVVAGSSVELGTLRRAVAVGARAIVSGGVEEGALVGFLGERPAIITGREEAGLTLIATEGLGRLAMLEKTFRLLRKFEGEMAFVNGATQMRAGVVRPEIIVPRGDIDVAEHRLLRPEGDKGLPRGVDLGDRVRIIREPHFGAMGTVVGLPQALRTLESEVEAMVLEVETEEGFRLTVPRANTEVIE